MKIRKILSSVFGSLALSSGSLWFGAYIARLLVTYQMFEPNELLLKSYLSNSDLPVIFQTIFPLVNLTLFSYLMTDSFIYNFYYFYRPEIKREWLVVYYFYDHILNTSFRSRTFKYRLQIIYHFY